MHTKKKVLTIIVLGLLSAIGPFSIDMYLPGFKTMAADLNTDVSRIQLSLTSFFLGIGIGQLLYGPLLDRFGRKWPLLIGLTIYFGASIACALTQSAEELIIYRFIQALGGCSGMVAARALVRDLFPPSDSAKVFSLLMLVIGVSPIIAPTVGGYIITYMDWHLIFLILSAFGALLIACVLFLLPEGRKANPGLSLKPIPTLKNFWEVLGKRQFFMYSCCGALAASGMYAYLAGSSYVMIEIYEVSEQQYGWIFGFLACALVASSQLNVLALNRFNSADIARLALFVQVGAGLSLVLLTLTGLINLYLTMALIFLVMTCQGFIFPNASGLAINPFSRLAGSASALLGCMQMSIGSLSSGAVSWLHNGTALPMAIVMAGCSFLSLIFLLSAPKKMLENGMY